MGRLFIEYLDSDRIYICTQCRTHIADCAEIISRVFSQNSMKNRHFMDVTEKHI